MLADFFQIGPLPANQMHGWYDIRLVILSYAVATFASYIALDITARLRDIRNTKLSISSWIAGGALAMGAGIWSMHFIGMLAFSLPMPMTYDTIWTVLSLLVAIAASAFALYILKIKSISMINFILGGIIMGIGIATMHYMGMHAMTNMMNIHYDPLLFALSIIIAIFASEAALWLALRSTEVIPSMRFRLKFVSAFVMGAAICGMHYTGMAAAVFTPQANMTGMDNTINPEVLAISIAAVTFIILGIAFIVSSYKESINQQLLLIARQAGMAEVAASVLHNVGNILNSINVSSSLLQENTKNSKISHLIQLKGLIQHNKNNLRTFIQEDERGKHIPELIENLADYWQSEQIKTLEELKRLNQNVEHVRSIIATQLDLSRVSELEQVVSIENVLEEAILITAIDNPIHSIKIEKNYESLKPVLIDKVKLLQILVNLVQNAKDAVRESTTPPKKVTFFLKKSNGNFVIAISDNGIGVAKENLTKIFMYGFTTKESGHGFGLHTSAILAKELGGLLSVTSEGKGRGAVFTLTLPYKFQ